MEPTWTDLVHLTIFDLTLKTDRKFHDFTVDFMPFFESSWDSLQLSKKFTNLPKERKRTEVKDVLGSDPRFEEGLESGQQKDLWALRVLAPPRRPPYRVPSVGIIQDRTVLNEVTIEEHKVVKIEECSTINIRDLNIVYKEYRPPEVSIPSNSTQTPHFSSQVISQ